jgi:polyphosphate kinase 2 (PPK2 family)
MPDGRTRIAPQQRWIVRRGSSTFEVFEGIEAASADEAIKKFLDGEGTLNQARTHHSEWGIEAEAVDE